MNQNTDFFDIYDYIYIPFWKTTSFIAVCIALLLILIFGSLYLFIRYRRSKQAIQEIVPPWQTALQELEKLNPTQYETKEEFKRFYFTLTQIIKKYLEQRFALDTIEKTDDELIAYLQNNNFNPTQLQKLERVLQGSLLIKFANAVALRLQATDDLKTIVIIVKETQPTGGFNPPGESD